MFRAIIWRFSHRQSTAAAAFSQFNLWRGLHSRTKKAMEFIAKGFSALKEIDRVIDHCEIGDKRLISGLTTAKENFELALEADNSNAHARYWLSKIHLKYHFCPGANKAVGAALLVEAAEMGDLDAQYDLGCNLRAENPYASDQQAFYYLEKAVDQLHPGALYLLGAVYLTGDCVKQDVSSAIWCFHRASEKGHAGAAIAYGSLILADMSWQRGLKIPSLDFDLGEGEASLSADKGSVDPQVTVSIPGGSVAIPDAVPVTSVRPSQEEKSQVSSAAKKRGAEQALQKESKKAKHGGKDKEKIISEKIPEKIKNKGKGIRRSSNDFFTLELPKSLAEMSKDDCVDFVRTLHTPDDNFFYKDFSPEQIQRSAIQRFVQFTTLFSRLVTAEGPLAVPELKDEIKKKDEELAKISSELRVVSKEREEFKERVIALEKELEDAKGRFVSKKAEAFSTGVKSRVELCRRRLFSSVVGQNFLKELHEGLIEAYRRSALYLEHMGPHMGHYIAHGFKSAYLRARRLGFSERLDTTNLEEGLTPSPEFQGDPNEDVGHPWWSPVIKSAVKTLINEELPDPELPRAEEMFYEVDDTSSSGAQTFDQLPELGSIADTTPPTFVD